MIDFTMAKEEKMVWVSVALVDMTGFSFKVRSLKIYTLKYLYTETRSQGLT